jgi:alkanesulfonate monooxygenase SsuD/methylene tetrahydromethanopterin reductase-like flavin-dependent oxidoreductase (luciferase family)
LKYGINIPNFGWFGEIDVLVDIAVEVEEHGWDGFFLWDHMLVFKDEPVLPFADPWVALAAIACRTEKIRLGPLITPLPRRRPWKVAREAMTLDHLSKGRLVLGVGIGAPPDMEFGVFGEPESAKIRAEMLDEGLQILKGLWSGEPYSHDGEHYHLNKMTFLPKSCQDNGIPIWVGGGWPHKAPFRRAAKYDGVAPVHSKWPETLKPSNVKDVVEIVENERGSIDNYDIVVAGETTGIAKTDREKLQPWFETGITWWLEDIHGMRAELNDLRERIRAGPPDVE